MELKLKQRVEELQQYRRLRIRSMAEVAEYEFEKKRREQQESQRKQRESSAYLYDTHRTTQRSSKYLSRDQGEVSTVRKRQAERGADRERGRHRQRLIDTLT